MVRTRFEIIAASMVALCTVGVPAVSSAQSYAFANDEGPSVAIECGPGQRSVVEQRTINGRLQVSARCEGAPARGVAYDEYGRALQARPFAYHTPRSAAYDTVRPGTRRSTVQYVERKPERSKTKSALMIAGSAATGAGVGAALKGTKGALVGAAIGGGAASIYESAKRQ